MSKHNTIGKGLATRGVNGGLDKFYTKSYIADFLSHLTFERYGEQQYIEPTAGSGAFLNVIPGIQGFDLSPEDSRIIQQDVFDLTIPEGCVVLGNPPFGMNASMAIRIFNHLAAQKPKAICFVVPLTFRKESTHNKLDLSFGLVLDQELPDTAFEVDGVPRAVPCCFQIWEPLKTERTPVVVDSSPWMTFCPFEEGQLFLRRAGGRAGQLITAEEYTKSSSYAIKSPSYIEELRLALQLMDTGCASHTSGVRSISKSEIFREVNRIMPILLG